MGVDQNSSKEMSLPLPLHHPSQAQLGTQERVFWLPKLHLGFDASAGSNWGLEKFSSLVAFFLFSFPHHFLSVFCMKMAF